MDHQGIPWKVFLIQVIHLQTNLLLRAARPLANRPTSVRSPGSSLGQRTGQNPGSPCRSVWFPPGYPWFICLSTPRPGAGSSHCLLITAPNTSSSGAAREASPRAQAGIMLWMCARPSETVPGDERLFLTQLLKGGMILTGRPSPSLCGGGWGVAARLNSRRREERWGLPSEVGGAPRSPRKLRPRGDRNPWLQVAQQVRCELGQESRFPGAS